MDSYLANAREIFVGPVHSLSSEMSKFVFSKRHATPRCKIWNINASRRFAQSSSNEPGSSLRPFFFVSMLFYRWRNGTCVFVPIEISLSHFPSLSFSFSLRCSPSPLSLFSPVRAPIQNGSRGRNRCYYNAATPSQSLVVEARPSFDILRSVSMSWGRPVWTAKRAGIASRLN